jgi:hypothetical protein
LDAVLLEPPLSPDDHDLLQREHDLEPNSSALDLWTGPVHHYWGFVSSQLMNSKDEEILYRLNDDWDWKWALRLNWAIKQHLDRAEDELDQLQDDFEAILCQSQSVQGRTREEV